MKTMNSQKKILSEKILTYKNRLNGDILYSNTKFEPKFIDGVEFLQVFTDDYPNRKYLIRRESLERL